MEITMTWFSNLKMELGMIKPDEFIDPGQEIEPGWTIVGDLPDGMKGLWTAYKNYARAAAEAQVEFNFCRLDEKVEKQGKFYELERKSACLNILLFIAIEDHFQLWDKPQTGLRKAWKVVYSDKQPEQQFPPFFRIG